MKLLLVEDDRMIGQALQKALNKSGYSIDWIQNGQDAEDAIKVTEYALIILDLGLPGKSGLQLLEDLRKKECETSVLILSARDSVKDRVSGLDLGADEYMTKPFALEELEARIRLLLRRRAGQKTNILKVGNLHLNLNSNELTYNDNKLILPSKEFAIMQLLMSNPKQAFSRSRLEENLYGWGEEVESNSVEVHIYQLRKKLGKEVIKTTRNVGYSLGKIT